MKINELIELLKPHGEKEVAVGIPTEHEGKVTLVIDTFDVLHDGKEVFIVPSGLLGPVKDSKPEPEKEPAGITRKLLEKLIPKEHLKKPVKEQREADGRINAKPCPLEKISGDAKAIVAYLEEHDLMRVINERSGMENLPLYIAYAIQAYYMGALR